jgi:hypothetical protein
VFSGTKKSFDDKSPMPSSSSKFFQVPKLLKVPNSPNSPNFSKNFSRKIIHNSKILLIFAAAKTINFGIARIRGV